MCLKSETILSEQGFKKFHLFQTEGLKDFGFGTDLF